MIPPSFSDLGKAAKDLFDKNFKFGKIAVDIKTKSNQGVEMNIKGDQVMKEGKLSGTLESVYQWNNGLKSTIKWDTTKKLFTTLSIEDAIQKGSKLTTDGSFHPDSGEKSLKATMTLKKEYFNVGLVSDFRSLTPIITPSLVLGCSGERGYVAGGELAFDTSRTVITRHKMALGYQMKELQLVASMQNFSEFESLIYQKLNSQVELGVKVNWSRNARDPDFGVVGRYNFEKDSFCKAKIDSSSKLGLAYGFKAKDNVDITLNAELDGKNLEGGAHRFGIELSYSP